MASPRTLRHLRSGVVVLLTLSVATCRLDMLLKPSAGVQTQLTVSPTEIRDSARAGSDDVRRAEVAITNGGEGTFTWSASERASWLRLDPREGEAPGTLTLIMDPDDLSPGTYETDVTVKTTDEPDSQATTIFVTFIAQRPGLVVLPLSLEHATHVNSGLVFVDELAITNSGNGQLNWTASKDRPWITLGATSGIGNAVVPVTINSAGLSPGTYRGEIVISAPGATGSPVEVDVRLTINVPGLAVTPAVVRDTALVGSTAPETQTLQISNSGTGTMTWTATHSQPWVTLSKTSGGAPDDVTITMNPTGLPAGTQRDEIVFNSPEATNDPVRIPVEFEILQPGLTVTPPEIDDTVPANNPTRREHQLAISNTGGGSLAWFATADRPWISLSPIGGLAPSTLTVTLDPAGMGPGAHEGTVTVTAPGASGSPATIPVSLVIVQEVCNEIPISPDVVRNGTLNSADCEAPHRPGHLANLYSLNANAGDTLSIRMTANFSPHLIFTDGAGNVLRESGSCSNESGNVACIREYAITASGRYLIEATSAAPGVSGQLTIAVIRERPPTPPQGLGQFRMDGNTAIGVGGATPEDSVIIRGRIDDPNLTDSVRLEIEIEPLGSPFTDVATHRSNAVSVGGTTVAVRTGVFTNNTGYHWQARTCDRTGRCSVWVRFGDNAENVADFRRETPPPPGGSPPARSGRE